MSLFGTDGVRGPAGEGILSAEGALSLGAAFAAALGPPGLLAVARDTRVSGGMLSAAVIAGALGAGWDVLDLGVVPTPTLSWLISVREELAGGVMITASHNPWRDNGLKLFGPDGGKVSDALQREVERGLGSAVTGASIGALRDGSDALSSYLDSLATLDLHGRVVVADTACGAAHASLPRALQRAGATVVILNPAPDGRNINEGCGAVHPESLAARVRAEGAWAGVALDGDGDRITLVDERGEVQDGDAILGFLAGELQGEGALRGGGVVGTITSNSGLERYLREHDLVLHRTPVGDRHVAQGMAEHGCNLGGESSGHVLTPDLCPTGDGTRVALDVLGRIAQSGGSLSEALGAVPRDPSAKRSVRVGARPELATIPSLVALLAEADVALGAVGARQLLRYSGTEPVLRIQVEGPEAALVERWADRLAQGVRAAIPEPAR